MEQWQKIRHLGAMGWSARRIAAELGLNRRTVTRALAGDAPPAYRREAAVSPLEPWQEVIEAGIRKRLRGSRVLRDIQDAGYTGSRAAFYARWSALAATQQRPEAACRFETDPGEQAQFDWAEYVLSLGGTAQKVYLYSLALGYSRRVHWFPSLGNKQDAVFEALEAGFQHFGGVCRQLVIDNPRVFLARRKAAEITWNANFLRFAGYYRVQPIACTPYHPQSKGKVENPFGHLEQLFLRERTWADWTTFQRELAAFEAAWERRIHGTTKVRPLDRFTEERDTLLALPPRPFLGWHEEFRHVSKDCLISFGGVRYSVPWQHSGQQVLIRQSQGREVTVYALNGEEVARHDLRPSGAPAAIRQEHYEGLKRRHQAAFAGLARDLRERYGPAGVAESFLQRLLAQHPHRPDQPLRQTLELLSAVPLTVAHTALADCLEYNVCTPRFLAERLRQRLQGHPEGGPLPAPAVQLPLPCLEIERSLVGYGRAITEPSQPA